MLLDKNEKDKQRMLLDKNEKNPHWSPFI
jgi:hypothetical protein